MISFLSITLIYDIDTNWYCSVLEQNKRKQIVYTKVKLVNLNSSLQSHLFIALLITQGHLSHTYKPHPHQFPKSSSYIVFLSLDMNNQTDTTTHLHKRNCKYTYHCIEADNITIDSVNEWNTLLNRCNEPPNKDDYSNLYWNTN